MLGFAYAAGLGMHVHGVAVRALADAFGTKNRHVSLVSGERGRDKVVQVTAPECGSVSELAEGLDERLGDSDPA